MSDSKTREMLPEVQTYIASIEAAQKVREDLSAKLHEQYAERGWYGTAEQRAQYEAHETAHAELYRTLDTTRDAAWALLKSSGDPLVKWIAENARHYSNSAVHVLKALPATEDELDAIADGHDWCGTWGRFKERARAAGVMPGREPLSAAHRAVLDAVNEEVCCELSARAQRRVSTLLNALVAEATAAQVAA